MYFGQYVSTVTLQAYPVSHTIYIADCQPTPTAPVLRPCFPYRWFSLLEHLTPY